MPEYQFTYYPDDYKEFGCKTAGDMSKVEDRIKGEFKGFKVSREDINYGDFKKAQFLVERRSRA
ncbi:hypothetical protein [Mastigocoleus testarum]|uniref:Uncharacterized protein n=1 Tax=Mastigocoleus testarum BC008 TaxID=371196 RepID=A0A0V7ZGE1_9CYAN|nr:hypothetical protein [Mastigocoleus testarum]KST63521.1 hypothetical protein BC008_13740 [Mastigocoleus testarum BC008]